MDQRTSSPSSTRVTTDIGSTRSPQSVQTWLTTNPAEFVLLMIGTNDITQDYQLSTAPDRLSGLIDQITNTLPGAQVLVASIPPLSDPTNNAKANQYNAAIPGIVNDKRAQGKLVTFVDVNAVLTTADLADGVHLTSTGYAKDGDAWFTALQPLLPPRPTPVPRTCPCTIWPTSAVPGTVQATWDTSPNELGVKFRSDVDGFVSGIRFYKGSLNTGTHVGHLWTRTGTALATATFTNETSSGWQEVAFSTPVAITADTTYVASYFAPVGRYSVDATYFKNNEVVNYPLRALAWGMSGPNGVYKFGSSGFPGSSSQYSNYWVDVVFAPASTPPPGAPANLTATAVSTSRIDLSWNDVATETGYRVERSANGTSGWAQVGTTGQNVTSYADTGLSSATTYFYRVIATNAGGDSPPSAVTSATTGVQAPAAPANLTATAALQPDRPVLERRGHRDRLPGGALGQRDERVGPGRHHRPERDQLLRHRAELGHHLLLPGDRHQRRRGLAAVGRDLGHDRGPGPRGARQPHGDRRLIQRRSTCPGTTWPPRPATGWSARPTGRAGGPRSAPPART